MVGDSTGSGNASDATPEDDDESATTVASTSGPDTSGSTGMGGETTDHGDSGEPGTPRCQDGNVDPGEQCDDGNDVNADGCNRDCRISGQLVWQMTVGAGFGAVDQAFDVLPQPDGSAVVGGYLSVDDTGARDGWLASYGPAGEEQWVVALAGPGGGNDEIRAVAGDGSGTLYAAGYTSGPEGQGLDAWVARYDGKGGQQWAEVFNGPDSMTDVFDTMVVDGDGNLILGGYSQSAASSNDVFLRKVDPDGAVLWSRVFPGPNGGTDLVWDVDVSPAGHIYAAGYEQGPAGEGRNAWLAKYDTDGNEIWSRSFNGPESLDDQLIGLTVIDDDDVVVSGYENGAKYPWQAIVRRYDSLGMIVWTDRYPGATNEGAHAFGMTVDPDDGQLVMTGGEIIGGIRHVLVRKYDGEGAERWTAVIPGGAEGPDYGRELRVAANGEVFVTGAMDTGADARDVWIGRFTP
jgi:cysteine-rich repeat protein